MNTNLKSLPPSVQRQFHKATVELQSRLPRHSGRYRQVHLNLAATLNRLAPNLTLRVETHDLKQGGYLLFLDLGADNPLPFDPTYLSLLFHAYRGPCLVALAKLMSVLLPRDADRVAGLNQAERDLASIDFADYDLTQETTRVRKLLAQSRESASTGLSIIRELEQLAKTLQIYSRFRALLTLVVDLLQDTTHPRCEEVRGWAKRAYPGVDSLKPIIAQQLALLEPERVLVRMDLMRSLRDTIS